MYATEQDMIDRFGDDEMYVAFDKTNDYVIDQADISRALIDADDEINAYLAGRYQLPLTTVPSVLTKLACHIAMYNGSQGTSLTDDKRQRYTDSVALLKKIANGQVSLGLERPAAGGSSGASFSSNDRLMGRSSLDGM